MEGPTPERPEVKKTIALYDHMGRPWKEKEPRVKSATWMRRLYYKGKARVGLYDNDGKSGDPIRDELVRAQIPWCCHVMVYTSKFQQAPIVREYFVHCSQEIQEAAKFAFRLWQRWEKPSKRTVVGDDSFVFDDMRDQYPKVEDGIIATPMADSDYESHWRDVRKRPHRAAGDPDDPFAFTCLDQDAMLFKTADFQDGLAVKIQ